MPIVVHKYGGSSVATLTKIKEVAALTVAEKRRGSQVVIVVSAMGKTTDGLMAQAFELSPHPDPRELDMLLSVGERITMSLLAMAIKDLGEDAISFTGSQSGIITNEDHAKATIVEVRPTRILEALQRQQMVIVAGYQGVSRTKEVTTLGRGGSDTTAVALAAALKADRCEIFSDVDGVFTADPRVVPQAHKLDQVSHVEMQELAHAGAKVLNPQAVEWAAHSGMTLLARQTGNPNSGTLLTKNPPVERAAVRAVAHRAVVLWMETRHQGARLLDGLQQLGVRLDLTWMSGPSLAVALPMEDLSALMAKLYALRDALGDCTLHQDWGCVSLVGAGAGGDAGVLARGQAALSQENVTVAAVWGGPMRLSMLVDSKSVPLAAATLHAEFVER